MARDVAQTPSNAPWLAAIRRAGPGRVLVDVPCLKAIYEAAATDEQKQRDRGNSGRIRTEFVVDQGMYEDGRYD